MLLESSKSWIQWIANGIHDFTVADHQKSPSEELIVSWPVHWVTLFSEEMIQSSFFECFQIMMFLCYFFVTTSSVFCFLFFFFKVQSKIGVRIIHGRALYKGKYGNHFLLPNAGTFVQSSGLASRWCPVSSKLVINLSTSEKRDLTIFKPQWCTLKK